MNASHSGDMYHFRAAMAVNPSALFLWNCAAKGADRKREELQDYLVDFTKHNKKNYLLAPIVTAPNASTKVRLEGWKFNGGDFQTPEQTLKKIPVAKWYNEGESTDLIRDAVTQNAAKVDVIKSAMAAVTLTATQKTELKAKFANLFISKDLESKKTAKPGVLIQHRDSGVKGGVYPELDSGDALKDLAAIVADLHYHPIILGSDELKDHGADSLGEYWKELGKAQDDGKSFAKHYQVPQRDIEAFYFDWAYRKGYYGMVIGFRSGMVDLFTFLGVPTVSIGFVETFPGEKRHQKLDLPVLKRTMVRYDTKRYTKKGKAPGGFAAADRLKVKNAIEGALRTYLPSM